MNFTHPQTIAGALIAMIAAPALAGPAVLSEYMSMTYQVDASNSLGNGSVTIGAADFLNNGSTALDPVTGTLAWNQTTDSVGLAKWDTGFWLMDFDPDAANYDGDIAFDGFEGGIVANVDPFIFPAFAFTNNTAVTTTYTITQSLNSTVAINNATVSGAIDVDLLNTSNDGNAAVLDAGDMPSDFFYTAFIGPDTVLQLLDDDTPLDPLLTSPNLGNTSNIDDSATSVATTTDLSVGETFGITFEFTLSPGDTITIASSFIIVPEPASLALLAAGLGVVGIRRRST